MGAVASRFPPWRRTGLLALLAAALPETDCTLGTARATLRGELGTPIEETNPKPGP